ncbi:uncharacterized protein LOC110893196 [Helianthus annuus]|uniref:uncharacterized protein LOC110893196 n=1 Tax=Helianthus annuus TaxID=4232 RepID=UPI000B8FB0B2|nr:uncharacterized protein LOC110893196 [Helianthus annuus]
MNILSLNIRGIGGSSKSGWVKDMVSEHGISFLSFQESKSVGVSGSEITKFWGKSNFGMDFVKFVGLSGGLICVWDNKIFHQIGGSKNRHFLHIKGTLVGCDSPVNVLNVYAPQGIPAKKNLWEELKVIIDSNDGLWVISGDFNTVWFREERRNCAFKQVCANNFNDFIFNTGLIEYNIRGRAFTFCSDNGNKLSKLDRFFANSDFFNSWPAACCRVLPRLWSDHNPILLVCQTTNFGLCPFRVFNSWFGKQGFEEVVSKAASEFLTLEALPDVRFIKKLQFIRDQLKVWKKDIARKEREEVETAMEENEVLETLLDSRDFSEEEEWVFSENKRIIREAEEAKVMDLRQRSRVKWAKEGDENSKFLHAMINSRKASNTIHGLEVNGVWISKPSLVKKEVFRFFRDKFVEVSVMCPRLVCYQLRQISSSVVA